MSARDLVVAALALVVGLCSALPLALGLSGQLVDVLLLGVGMGVVWALLRRHPIG